MEYSYPRRFDDRRNHNMQNMRGRSCGCNNPARPTPPASRPEPRSTPQSSCNSYSESSENRFPLGMAYVPTQTFQDIFPIEEGFKTGTIFRELDFPFTIGFCARGCDWK